MKVVVIKMNFMFLFLRLVFIFFNCMRSTHLVPYHHNCPPVCCAFPFSSLAVGRVTCPVKMNEKKIKKNYY